MLTVQHFNQPEAFERQREIVALYDGIVPFAQTLHYILTGVSGAHLFVAFVDDVPAGTIVGAGVVKTAEAVAPIGQGINPLAYAVSDMVVTASHRRRGVGLAVLRAIEGFVARNGGRIVYLYTEASNVPAIALYERAGFERLADQRDNAVFAKLTRGPDGTHAR